MTLIGLPVRMPFCVTLPCMPTIGVGPLGCGLVSGVVAGMTAGLDLTTGTFSQKGHGTLDVRQAAETLTVFPEPVDPLVSAGFGMAAGVALGNNDLVAVALAVGTALSVGAAVATGVGVGTGVGVATGVGETDSTGASLGDGMGSAAKTMAPDPATMHILNTTAAARLTLDEAIAPLLRSTRAR